MKKPKFTEEYVAQRFADVGLHMVPGHYPKCKTEDELDLIIKIHLRCIKAAKEDTDMDVDEFPESVEEFFEKLEEK